jgi:hypothetical protein
MKSLNPRRQSAKDGIHFELREQLLAAVLDALAAVALSSPSKSDLQQRDILIVEDRPAVGAARDKPDPRSD